MGKKFTYTKVHGVPSGLSEEEEEKEIEKAIDEGRGYKLEYDEDDVPLLVAFIETSLIQLKGFRNPDKPKEGLEKDISAYQEILNWSDPEKAANAYFDKKEDLHRNARDFSKTNSQVWELAKKDL